jgi:GR25 family glycosyltransferase involved in LPS biosynthesis
MNYHIDNIIMFDRIYYINLDRRPDRRDNIEKLIKHHKLNDITERVPAVDGSKLNLNNISNTIISKKGIDNANNLTMRTGVPMTPGAIGCALSHRNVWSKIVDNKINAALIMEDDIKINNNFMNDIEKYSKDLPPSYDIIFIGYHPASIKYVEKSNFLRNVFLKSKKVYGLFGYVVTLEGAKKLLKLFPIEDQIDTEIYRGFTTHNIDAYVIRPDLRLITSDPSEVAKEFGTDIQVRQTNKQINEQTTKTKESFSNSTPMLSYFYVTDIFSLIMLFVFVILLVHLIDTLLKLQT